MKKSNELIGLPLLAIMEGDFVAKVHLPVVNPEEGKIDYLLLEGEEWFLEKKAIAFSDISAVGTNAVTTEKADNVKPVSKFEHAIKLLKNEIRVLGCRVMTRDGRLVGTVSEFIFDETSGKITGCELTPENDEKPIGVIPASKIVTFGRRYLVVTEDADTTPEKEPNGHGSDSVQPPAPETPEKPARAATEEPGESAGPGKQQKDPLELFSEKQRQYLIGKKAGKTIIDANGNIVVSEGATITEDVINRAMRVDKYVELTMYVE